MKAFILIKVRAGEVSEAVSRLRTIPAVTEAHMTFGPYDAIAIVEAPGLGEIGALVASTIQPIPGIEQTLTCLAAEP